jgi:hypothetical protein
MPKPKLAPAVSIAKKSAATIKRVESKPAKQVSSKSNFAPKGHRRLTCNLHLDAYTALKMLSLEKRKPAGAILEELIVNYGDRVKAYKHPVEDME